MVENVQDYVTGNRKQIAASTFCVCMDCRERFPPEGVERFLNEGPGTAVCPACGNDAVVGDASGLPIGDPAFLDAAQARWVGPTAKE
ncbi:MAG: hypothetical protein QM773_07665 [Hyphomonadaceae bacterium]